MLVDNDFQAEDGGDPLTANPKAGVNTLINELRDGKPVMVGVTYGRNNPGNHNRLTDHFITVVGMGYDKRLGQNYFSYIDNYGTHPQDLSTNRLYFDGGGRFITGPGYNPDKPYFMTEVRPNVKGWWPW